MSDPSRLFSYSLALGLSLSISPALADINEYEAVAAPSAISLPGPGGSLPIAGDVEIGDTAWGAVRVDAGSELDIAGITHLAVGNGTHGNLDVRDNLTSVVTEKLRVATGSQSTGSVHIGAGATLNQTTGCCITLAYGTGAVGSINVAGGTLNVTGEDPDPSWDGGPWINLGRNGGVGALDITDGGTVLFEFISASPASSFPEPGMGIGRSNDSVGIVRLRNASNMTFRGRNPIVHVARGNNPDVTKGVLVVSGGSSVVLDPNPGKAIVNIARFPGTVGVAVVEGAGSILQIGDGGAGSGELCVGGSANPCATDGGDATLIIRDGGAVTACEVTVRPGGRIEQDSGTLNSCPSTVHILGTLAVKGNSTVNGGLNLGSEGRIAFNSDASGNVPTLTVNGDLELHGSIVLQLAGDVSLEEVGELNLIDSTDPTPTGSANLVIRDSTGMEVATIEDVNVDQVDDVLNTLSENVEGGKVVVCHTKGNGEPKTLSIGVTSVGDHLAHGDNLGACS